MATVAVLPPQALHNFNDPCSFGYANNNKANHPPSSSGSGTASSSGLSKSSSKRRFFQKLFRKKSRSLKDEDANDRNKLPAYESVETEPEPTPETGLLQPGLLPIAERSAESVVELNHYHYHDFNKSETSLHSVLSVRNADVEPAPRIEPMPIIRGKSVRMAHPVVADSRPITPLDHDVAKKSFYNSQSPNHSTETLKKAPLRPKQIWRDSAVFKTPEGELMPWGDFKSQLDGHRDRTSKRLSRELIGDAVPSLGFLPTVGAFTIADEPVFQSDSTPADPVKTKQNRDSALEMLEGGQDVPNTLAPKQFPGALTPGKRPYSMLITTEEKYRYEAFTPSAKKSAVKFADPAPTLEEITRPQTPTIFDQKPEDFAADLYARVESGLFGDADTALPTPPPAPKVDKIARKPVEPLVLASPLASQSTSNLLLAKPLPPTPRPVVKQREASVVPEPHKMNDSGFPVIKTGRPSVAKATWSPPPAKYETKVEVKLTAAVPQRAPAPAPVTRPASPRPARNTLERRRQSGVPQAHRMNDSAFPVIGASSKRNSAAIEPSSDLGKLPSVQQRKSRPVSTMTLDRLMLDELERERKELDEKIALQAEKVARKARARTERNKTATAGQRF